LRTIAGMVHRLGDGFQFKIITSDRDMLDKEPYARVTPDSWNSLGKAEVYYCSPNKQSLRDFRKLVAGTDYDALYLNSCCGLALAFQILLLRQCRMIPDQPVVLAPRGARAWR
jgi:predicted P-loop ATPase